MSEQPLLLIRAVLFCMFFVFRNQMAIRSAINAVKSQALGVAESLTPLLKVITYGQCEKYTSLIF